MPPDPSTITLLLSNNSLTILLALPQYNQNYNSGLPPSGQGLCVWTVSSTRGSHSWLTIRYYCGSSIFKGTHVSLTFSGMYGALEIFSPSPSVMLLTITYWIIYFTWLFVQTFALVHTHYSVSSPPSLFLPHYSSNRFTYFYL